MKHEGFIKISERSITKDGYSLSLTIPAHMVQISGLQRGDKVSVYSDGQGLMLVDLTNKRRD